MRSKKALQNTLAGIGYEIVAVICGLILPRLILGAFGSKYNGITSSITQFLSCIALMKAGIGGVSRAALYKALTKNDNREISSIVKATQNFMSRVSIVFVIFIVIFSVIYSGLMLGEFDRMFTVTLILIIGISTFGEYYFGFTYEVLLSADQRQCVSSIIRIFTTILNTIVASILIHFNFGIHAVKLGSSIVFLINPLVINFYARKKYKIVKDVEANSQVISQRWDAVAHEVANFINTNTDVMVLTIFSSVLEVSVYTVYNTVIVGIRKLVNTFINGFGAAFGNMLAKGEMELMENNFRIYELIVFSLVSVIYSTASAMFVPYAVLYTSNVADVNYARPLFALIITLAGAFSCVRIPYQNIVTVAGHFKQTRNGAITEAVLNIVISCLAVIKFGLVGVAVGTIVANVFRTVQYAIYMSKNILKRPMWHFIKHIIVFGVVFIVTNIAVFLFVNTDCETVAQWIVSAIITGVISVGLTAATDMLLYNADVKRLIGKSAAMFKTMKK